MQQYVLGKKAVIEAYKSKKLIELHIKTVFPEVSDIKKSGIPVVFHHDNKFFSQFSVNHQNIIGVIKTKEKMFEENYSEFINKVNSNKNNLTNKKIILILDEIQDAGNFGSIMRTCSGFGIDGIIFKKDNQVQINETVIKTSMGSYDQLNLLRAINISNIIDKLKEDGYWVISSALDQKTIDISKQKFDLEKVALIVGNENNGVSKNILKKSDAIVKIPMSDLSVQSFNVSVSTGILLYYLIF